MENNINSKPKYLIKIVEKRKEIEKRITDKRKIIDNNLEKNSKYTR